MFSKYASILNTNSLDIHADDLTLYGLTENRVLGYVDKSLDTAGVTTDMLPEGKTNLYYSPSLVFADFDTRFATKTTDNLAQGVTNKYYASSLFNADLATKFTTDLAEGTNLYYTDARARASVSASGSNLSYNSSTGAFSFTATPSFLGLTIGTLNGIPKCYAGLITGAATTSDCPEGSNLYYLDSRARAALSAGTGISYNSSTGVISNSGVSSITGTSNQVLANGLGGTTQTGAVTLSLSTNQSLSSDTVSSIRMEVAGSSYPSFTYKRAKGSLATRTSVALNDYLQRSIAQGYSAEVGGYVDSAAIDYQIDATPDVISGGTPCAIIFSTNDGVTTSISEKMRISSVGYVGIGGVPSYKLQTAQTLAFASRGANPLPAQIVASSSTGQLKLGNYYTAGVGTCGTIQASDYYSGADHATPLLLNPLGGYVGIGTTSPQFPLHINSSASPQLVLEDGNAGLADMRHYVYGVLKTIFFSNSESAQLRTLPNIPLYLGYNSDIQVTIGDTTSGYPTAMTLTNQTTGPCLKLQESAGTGRGHIQIGSSSTAANNIHIGCEGNGSFYVWNGNWGYGTQKFQIGSTGNFRFDNNSGYSDNAIYGVGGSYLTLFNTNSGGHSSQIGHDATTLYINTGAGGDMYFQTYAAGYSALNGRMVLDQAGRLSFNSMTADATLSLLGTAGAPLAGIALGGWGYDATPYHRLELANGAGSYIYYMSQNIKWSSPNNRWEFVNTGGWGGYGSVFNFYGNGNAAFSTASNVAGLPSFKTNLALTNDGNCTVGYNLNVSGTIQATLATPASSSAAGTAGQIKWDASYIYVCTATNTWKRVALSTF